jgi:hypothetical protein
MSTPHTGICLTYIMSTPHTGICLTYIMATPHTGICLTYIMAMNVHLYKYNNQYCAI